jgi:hypothetical protein
MKQRVVQAFAERVSRAILGQDLQVIYRVVGGMPSQRVDYEVIVDPVGGARVAVSDARTSRTAKLASFAPEDLDVGGLFQQISAGLHSLLPASRATFPPDAYVGSITIRVGDNEEVFYFVPEAEKRRAPGKGVAPLMDQALQRFWGIAKSVTEAQEGAKYE